MVFDGALLAGAIRRVLLVLLALALVTLAGSMMLAQQGSWLAVRGGSMEPAIPLGSLISTSAVAAEAVRAGDILTIRADNGVVITHRVLSVIESGGERYFELRGDANATPDAVPVPARAVVGRVDFFLPLVGFVIGLLSMPSGVVSVAALFAAGLLGVRLLRHIELGQRRLHPSDAPSA